MQLHSSSTNAELSESDDAVDETSVPSMLAHDVASSADAEFREW